MSILKNRKSIEIKSFGIVNSKECLEHFIQVASDALAKKE